MIHTFQLFIKPISPKKNVIAIFSMLSILFIFHTTVWFLFTKNILDIPSNLKIGDLARLSYQIQSIQLRDNSITNLDFKHLESKNYKHGTIDILTIGDSFSNGGAGGINPYYQDYIATIYQKKVLNISPSKMDKNYIETIMSLYNNGYLEKIKPKLIILGSVERAVIKRFTKEINWNYKISEEQSLKNFNHSVFNVHKQENISVINNGNYDFILNPILYQLANKPIQRSGVYRANLKCKLFSAKADKKLLFHKEEVENIPYTTNQNILILNNNLNKLASLLQKKNIKLAFMPAVDKYNLYSPYILNNKFPKSKFFELIRPLNKIYYFIDTKAILAPLLPKTKDLYYADDTHWNYIAAEEIIKYTPFNIILKEEKNHAL